MIYQKVDKGERMGYHLFGRQWPNYNFILISVYYYYKIIIIKQRRKTKKTIKKTSTQHSIFTFTFLLSGG